MSRGICELWHSTDPKNKAFSLQRKPYNVRKKQKLTC
jgi:hypothetical protein